MSSSSLLPPAMALRASFLFFLLITPALCLPTGSSVGTIVDDASTQVVFTPSECNQGQLVVGDKLPEECDEAWFITSDGIDTRGDTWHATRSSNSRVSIQFQGSGVSWFSAPANEAQGAADVYLDGTYLARVRVSPDNSGPVNAAWSRSDIATDVSHNLTIVPVGDGIVTVDFLLILPHKVLSASKAPVLISTEADPSGAAEKDGSSGAIISAASFGSVALVVVACGGCFFLGKRRKRPGFHMPTVLVDIESARDHPDTPSSSPTSVRPPWRDSARKSVPGSEFESESAGHEHYPPDGASNSRPPSYRSGQEPLYPPGPSSQSREGHA